MRNVGKKILSKRKFIYDYYFSPMKCVWKVQHGPAPIIAQERTEIEGLTTSSKKLSGTTPSSTVESKIALIYKVWSTFIQCNNKFKYSITM